MQQIFVTGGSKGIGLETARLFARNGFRVGICASSEASVAAIREQYPSWEVYQCDMGSKLEVKALGEKILRDFGTLDVLVNNVGKFKPGAIHSEDDDVFEEMMDVNLFGTYYLTKMLLPPMMAQQRGTLFNICSIASIQAYPNGGSYSIAKHALLGFSKGLREEMKPHGLRVVSVLPGATLTDSWAGVELPPERFIPAEDIAAILWDTWCMSPRTVIEEIVIRPQLGDL